jgi:hypothetical protein
VARRQDRVSAAPDSPVQGGVPPPGPQVTQLTLARQELGRSEDRFDGYVRRDALTPHRSDPTQVSSFCQQW